MVETTDNVRQVALRLDARRARQNLFNAASRFLRPKFQAQCQFEGQLYQERDAGLVIRQLGVGGPAGTRATFWT